MIKLNSTIEIETFLIENYFLPKKRERYLSFIKSPKNRTKLIEDLSSFKFIDFELFDRVPTDINETEFLMEKLKIIEECYCISENRGIDNKFLSINNALSQTIYSNMGTILFFEKNNFVYLEGEMLNNRWISNKLKARN